MSLQAKLRPAWRVLRIPLVTVTALLLLYALAGFLLVPWLAKRELPLDREANSVQRADRCNRVQSVHAETAADEFALDDKNGKPCSVSAELPSISNGVRLFAAPGCPSRLGTSVRIEVSKDGRINLAALAPHSTTTARPNPSRPFRSRPLRRRKRQRQLRRPERRLCDASGTAVTRALVAVYAQPGQGTVHAGRADSRWGDFALERRGFPAAARHVGKSRARTRDAREPEPLSG